jgi:hypothetical protein
MFLKLKTLTSFKTNEFTKCFEERLIFLAILGQKFMNFMNLKYNVWI